MKTCQNSQNDSGVSLEGINEFFRTTAITDGHQPGDSFVPSTAHSSISDSDHIEPSVVVSLLESLDIRKSTGPEGLSALFLK